MDHLARLRNARAAYDKTISAATATLHNVIADALRAETPVQDIAEAAGYHRNHIGRIRRAAGIPDARRRRARAPHHRDDPRPSNARD